MIENSNPESLLAGWVIACLVAILAGLLLWAR